MFFLFFNLDFILSAMRHFYASYNLVNDFFVGGASPNACSLYALSSQPF